jgi:hypothetical protein
MFKNSNLKEIDIVPIKGNIPSVLFKKYRCGKLTSFLYEYIHIQFLIIVKTSKNNGCYRYYQF